MGIQEFPQVDANATLAQVREILAETNQLLDFVINGKLDSRNIREIAGYLVGLTEFKHKSGLVGLNGADPLNPNAIRLWAGLADMLTAPFRVNQAGQLFATDGFFIGRIEGSTIIGSEIKTSESEFPRIELSTLGTFFKALGAIDKSIEISISTVGTPGLFFRDPGGLGLIDNEGGVMLIATTADMNLSANNGTITGVWSFPGNVSFTNLVTGKITNALYADNAGSAASADSLAPSGSIPWGQVNKTGSNISDIATKNLSSLTEDATHRTVTDTEKSTWNAKWGGTTTSTRSAFRAYQSAAQTLPANTLTKINFQTELYDQLNEYDNTNMKYTVTAAGIYQISACLHLPNTQPAGNRSLITIYVNGVRHTDGQQYVSPTADYAEITVSVPIKVSAGDYIEIYGLSVASVALLVNLSYFTAVRVA